MTKKLRCCSVFWLLGSCVHGQQVSKTNHPTSPSAWTSGSGMASPRGKQVSPAEVTVSGSPLSTTSNKVKTLRLAPNFSTVVRMGETVSSVVVGDPEHFLAEHSDKEPELVFVKPTTSDTAQSDLIITTAKGHTVTLLLKSDGEASGRGVDVVLNLSPPHSGQSSFLVEDSTVPNAVIPESVEASSPAATRGPRHEYQAKVEPASFSARNSSIRLNDAPSNGNATDALDQLLARQRTAPLPQLYGQKPGRIPSEPLVKAGVSEVIDGGDKVIVLFAITNPSKTAIELLPPQVQLGGQDKKGHWETAEQLTVDDYRLSLRRVPPGGRADGVVVFERPAWKLQKQMLFLQMAESGAVDRPALAPVGFGISSTRGGIAYAEQ